MAYSKLNEKPFVRDIYETEDLDLNYLDSNLLMV